MEDKSLPGILPAEALSLMKTLLPSAQNAEKIYNIDEVKELITNHITLSDEQVEMMAQMMIQAIL